MTAAETLRIRDLRVVRGGNLVLPGISLAVRPGVVTGSLENRRRVGYGVITQIAAAWGTWRYTVSYDELGATAAALAPKHPRRPIRDRLRKVGDR